MPLASKQDEEKILSTFRKELIADGLLHEGDTIGTDDETLLRFLRARKFNLKASKKMWADCQHWRQTVEDVGIDELYRTIDPFDYPEREAVFNCWPLWFHKTDKKGRPINIHYFGGVNMPEMYKHISPEKHWQTVIVNAEALPREVLPACTRAAGKPIGTVLVIIDLKNFSVAKFWQVRNLARQSFQISQDYFPETMGQVAIVNAPSSFAWIWSVMRPWMAVETVEKINIMGHDFKTELLKIVDADSLPVNLGGTCTCEGFGGCRLSNAGPWSEGRVWEGKKAQEVEVPDSEQKGDEKEAAEPDSAVGAADEEKQTASEPVVTEVPNRVSSELEVPDTPLIADYATPPQTPATNSTFSDVDHAATFPDGELANVDDATLKPSDAPEISKDILKTPIDGLPDDTLTTGSTTPAAVLEADSLGDLSDTQSPVDTTDGASTASQDSVSASKLRQHRRTGSVIAKIARSMKRAKA